MFTYLSRKSVLLAKIKSADDRKCFTIRVSDDHEQELQCEKQQPFLTC